MKALPSVPAATRLPYLGAQILAGLGASPTALTERAVKRIKKTLPVPVEQEILWADAVFGTRTHGLVITDAGLFLKDGPSGDEDDEEDWSESEGAGYHYLRWRNFDPEVVLREKGRPCVGGVAFHDPERFEPLARQCSRIVRSRNRTGQIGANAALEEGLAFGPGCATLFCKTAALTAKACISLLNETVQDKIPLLLVPSTQYDAVVRRLKAAIEKDEVVHVGDPSLIGAFLKCSAFTFRQAMNLAETGRIPGLMFDPLSETVSCANPFGIDRIVYAWLAGRSGVRGLDPAEAQGPRGIAREAFEADGGIPDPEPKNAQEAVLNLAATNAMYSAGRSVGVAGARVLVGALGAATGPFAAMASFALGNMVGDAVPEAFNMAKSLFVEPAEKVYGRLFDGVLRNVVFEYALTEAEQAVLGAYMRKIDPNIFKRLLIEMRESDGQEDSIREFVVPLVEAVRKH